MKIESFIALFAFSPIAYAADVCCVAAKVSQDSIDTQASAKSEVDCKSWGSDGDFKICSGFPDPNNLCSEVSKEKQCKTCGYFWTGNSCMKEDPVAKAKAELEKEQKEKAEKEKKD